MSLLSSVDAYTAQLRQLEEYIKTNPKSADARFVLAYHYITASHEDAAVEQLQQVVKLLPADRLSVQLIQLLGGEPPARPGAAPAPAPADQGSQVADEQPPELPNIDPAKIVGRRTAKRADGTTFTLDLTDDNKFTWGYERGGKKHEFGGTYSIDGAVLLLERSNKSIMPGLVTMKGTGFNFALFGAPEGDVGLDFES